MFDLIDLTQNSAIVNGNHGLAVDRSGNSRDGVQDQLNSNDAQAGS